MKAKEVRQAQQLERLPQGSLRPGSRVRSGGLKSPELIPIVAPIGSAVGSSAEKELRKRIKF